MQWLKVGELAKRTGVSIRTLHYYDEIDLLAPSHHTPSGHRMYTSSDVIRLQQIKSLQQLGFSLEEVRGFLRGPQASPQRVLEMHRAHIRERIGVQTRLLERLEAISRRLEWSEEISVDDFLSAIEEMTMFEKYYTPEQLEKLENRRTDLGEDRIREAEGEWAALIAEVATAVKDAVEPTSEPAIGLARRWMDLIRQFTGADPGIARSVATMYEKEPQLAPRFGITPEMSQFINEAFAASGDPDPHAP